MIIEERPTADLEYEIEPSVQELLLQHPGKWAALARSELIAIGDTSTEAYDAALAAGVQSPILYLVPDNRTGYSYF